MRIDDPIASDDCGEVTIIVPDEIVQGSSLETIRYIELLQQLMMLVTKVMKLCKQLM